MRAALAPILSILAFVAILFFHSSELLTTALVSLLVLIAIVRNFNRRFLVFTFVIAAVATVVEMLFVSSGVWTYPSGILAGVPLWIPLVWVIGAYAFGELFRVTVPA